MRGLARWRGEDLRSGPDQSGRNYPERAEGPLAWLHAGADGIEPETACSLAERLTLELPEAHLLITTEQPADLFDRAPDTMTVVPPPFQSVRPIRRFLEHWRPDAGIWMRKVEAPQLLNSAAAADIPLFLQDAVAPTASGPRSRTRLRSELLLFRRILALNAREAQGIRTLAAPGARVEATGPLVAVATAPPYAESEREALAHRLQARPVWLASGPTDAELPAVLEAHRLARRSTHRLLLILVPRSEGTGAELSQTLSETGWVVRRREVHDYPDDTTEILIGDFHDELGLYYRLAPITFLGGTLSGETTFSPLGPAALGSAILCGPQDGGSSAELAQLRRAGGCQMVHRPADLGEAVSALLAPARAATLALNAWQTATEGATVQDRLVQVVTAALKGVET